MSDLALVPVKRRTQNDRLCRTDICRLSTLLFQQADMRGAADRRRILPGGNAIGGGDWGLDRLIPDCVRALHAGRPICIRNPRSVRPWQHVLELLSGYLWLGARLWEDPEGFSGA